VDNNKKINYSEFIAATVEAHGELSEERLADAFDRIDSDDDGFVTVEDLRDFLGDSVPQYYIDQIIEEADISHDHMIDYPEFLALWDRSIDDVRLEALRDVESRRVSRAASRTSSLDTWDDRISELTFSEDEDMEGTYGFQQRKEASVRMGSIIRGVDIL
jgi:hypothetical protein